jgi:hypothetical protein
MPLVTLQVNADRSGLIHADWTHTSFSTYWENIVGGGPAGLVIVDRIQHNGNYSGTEAEISVSDIGTIWDAYAAFSEVRCRAVRCSIWASLLNPLSLVVANVGIEYSPGAATEVRETTIQHPGNTPVQVFDGLDFLETISSITGPWAEFKDDGSEWTRSDLNALCLVIKGWHSSRVYLGNIDVILDLQCLANFGEPHFTGQQIGKFQRFSWRFNSRGEGIPQKKYHIKIFKESDWVFGLNIDTATNQVLEALEESANNWHDFHYKVGGRLVPSLPPGDYHFCVKVARDFFLTDWWSPWINVAFTVPELGGKAITSPAASTTTTSRPTISWTPTVSRRTNWSEIRVYRLPLPVDFNIDSNEIEPWWSIVAGANVVSQKVEKALENGNYRAYIRTFDQVTDEWGFWAEYNWTQSVTGPSAPALTVLPDASNSRVSVISTFYSGKQADKTVSFQVKRTANGETLPVRIMPNDVYDDKMLAIPDGLRPVGLRLPGEAFAGVRLPNSTGLQPTTGIDIEVGVLKPDGWATITGNRSLFARWDGLSGNFRSWDFQLLTDRKLFFRWSTAGTSGSIVSATSTIAMPEWFAISEMWLRVQLSLGSPWTCKFWYSSNQGGSWTQLGADVVGAGATSIFNTTSTGFVDIGGSEGLLADQGAIVVSHFRLRNSIGGTIVAGAEFTGPNEYVPNPSSNLVIAGTNTSYFYQLIGTDYEAPHNKSLLYSARGVVLNGASNELRYGSYALGSAFTLDNETVWLKDLSDSTRNARFLSNQAWLNRETNKFRSARQPLGRTLPIMYKSSGRGEKFEFSFTCIGAAAVDGLIEILDGGGTLQLTTPKRTWYVEVDGNWTQSDHLFDERDGELDARIITVPFIEVEAPDVPSIA